MYHKPIQKSLSVILATNLNAAHNMTNTNIYGQNKPLWKGQGMKIIISIILCLRGEFVIKNNKY